MKKKIYAVLLSVLFLGITSCEKDEVVAVEPDTNDDLNYFLWRGLNLYYLWNQEVPDLADNRFSGFDDLYTYYRGFSSPESIFESLLYQPGTVDLYSVLIPDYVEWENASNGIVLSSGMDFGLVRYASDPNKVFGYVRYVLPNTPAFGNVQRGMIFNSVNGTELNINNYRELLFNDEASYTIGFADFNNGNPISNDIFIDLNKRTITENPVYIAKVIVEGGKKIGYLMYNQFVRNFDGNLNAAFAYFKTENIDELIVDLRYNPGGSTSSATYLASMITGQYTNEVFSIERWNQKVTDALGDENFINRFTNQIRNVDINGEVILNAEINSLSLNRAYFIVSNNTASASELVINGLSSYIDVHLIGTQTVGKQVGSITLYDSENLLRTGNDFNEDHRYAMQPIVFEITNKDGENDANGYIPEINLPGIQISRDYDNLGQLGERTDPILARTLEYITTGSKGIQDSKSRRTQEEIFSSKLASPLRDNMFADDNQKLLNKVKALKKTQ